MKDGKRTQTRTGLSLHEYKWGAIVCDESVRLANPKASTTKYLTGKFKHIPLKYVLCGQPAPEDDLQFVCQFLFVQNDFMGFHNYYSARDALCELKGRFNWTPTTDAKSRIYHYVHKHAFIATRAQAGIGSKKLYEVRHIDMTKEQKKAYDAMKNNFAYNGIRTKYTITQVNYLAQIAGGLDIAEKEKWLSTAKVKEVISLIKGELKRQQVLIWCRFRHEQDLICKTLHAAGLVYERINGDTPSAEREQIRQRFNAGIVPYVVPTISSMKVGVNYADRCDTAIYYSNEYSNDARSQSEDRIIHPTKKTPVLIIDLVTRGTIDEHVLSLLREKKFNSEMLMSSLFKNLAESVRRPS